MAGPKKKPRNPSKSGSEESENEENDSGTYLGQKEIQATFEGRNPESHDFHGIKQLLNQLFLKAHIDLSQLSDLLIAQNGIGSVLKQGYGDSDDEDEEDVDMNDKKDVFGITSVISLTSPKNTPCIQQFYSLLEELGQKHADESVQNSIKNIVTKHRMGFLINERFVNIPAQISLPLFTSLSDEIDRMAKKYPSYNFEYYILICKTSRSKDNKDEEFFTNEEEEIFSKEADLTFDFSVADETDVGLGGKWLANDQQVIPYRRIVIFKADKLKNIIAKISTLVQSA